MLACQVRYSLSHGPSSHDPFYAANEHSHVFPFLLTVISCLTGGGRGLLHEA